MPAPPLISSGLPNLIVAGVNKAGTTSLFSYLIDHPDVCGSRTKETCHFLPLRFGESMESIDLYKDFFRGCEGHQLILESTPGYFYGGRAVAEAIDSSLPGVRIVLVLREPIARLLSFFRFQVSMLNLDADSKLEAYLQHCQGLTADQLGRRENNIYFGLEGGRYSNYLSDWAMVFGERLRIVFFDDLVQTPQSVVSGIWRWFGLKDEMIQPDKGAENKTRGFRFAALQRAALTINQSARAVWRRFPRIKVALRGAYVWLNGRPADTAVDEKALEFLKGYYADSNRKLAKQLRALGLTRLPEWLTEGDDQ